MTTLSHGQGLKRVGLSIFLAAIMVASSLLVVIPSGFGQQVNALSITTSEPLTPSTTAITKSFTYPTLQFKGQTVASLTETITWNIDGTTKVSDSRGYQYTIAIPSSQGNFSLFQNSTVIDQKVISNNLSYDIFWKPVTNVNGYVDKYKFTIAGTSIAGSTILLSLNGGNYFEANGNRFLVTETAANINNSLSIATLDKSFNWTATGPLAIARANSTSSQISTQSSLPLLDGLGLDWSDAVAAGYSIKFDKSTLVLSISVGKSFSIDPTTIATISQQESPQTGDYFEGEIRMVHLGNTTVYAFYYDGSNIVYKTSTDWGQTWSSTTTSTGSGTLASDTYRWNLVGTVVSKTTYFDILYWSPSGSNMNFYAIRGTVGSSSITWSSPVLLGYTAANSLCGTGGACAAVAASADTNGNIYAAFSWLSGGASTYSYEIIKSTDGGLTWSTSLAQVNGVSANRPTLSMVGLSSGKMLFAYALYETGEFSYRIFDGTSWGAVQTTSSSGMTANTVKEDSASGNQGNGGYIAYLTGGTSGTLKLANWTNTGSPVSFQTADSTLSHALPSIRVTYNGDIHITTLANNLIYDTKNVNGKWVAPFNPHGTTFSSPNQLTAATPHASSLGAMWTEGSASPWTLKIDILAPGFVDKVTTTISPTSTDSYEGEHRTIHIYNHTDFTFYYDGSNIVYKSSTDEGNTFIDSPISTGSGTLASDNYRWTVTSTVLSGRTLITVLYWTPSGTNMNFNALRGNVSGSTITWTSPILIGNTAANSGSCGTGGACAAVAAATDTNGNIYAAFRWLSGGATQYAYEIVKSADGGKTWSTSLPEVYPVSTTHRMPLTITSLSSGKMLFAYATYESANLIYRVFDGSSWGAEQTLTGTGWSTNVDKQISSGTVNSTQLSYIAFLSGGTSGTLEVARFSNTGAFQAFETADSTLTHWLPSITVGQDNVLDIHTLANGKVYATTKNGTTWYAPKLIYGNTFDSPDQLTADVAGPGSTGSTWVEGSTSPKTLVHNGIIASVSSTCLSPVGTNPPISGAEPCTRYFSVAGSTISIATPVTMLGYSVGTCYFLLIVPYTCATTNVEVAGYPSSLNIGGVTYDFVYGSIDGSFEPFGQLAGVLGFGHLASFTSLSDSGTVKITPPTHSVPLFPTTYDLVVTLYYQSSTCGCGSGTPPFHAVQLTMRMPQGYAD